ncbi:alpha-amylase family glycosyl hydrolase [Sphingomonas sp. RIT328]|uniref:alpha-amylase family glycosyl hydrolase n=1 Tax=Sphingomonas sp. RIT328 TaxID=1470591 RepID=UPI000451849C|nr:alpha-amylase family glycosyl hydrolase [Sphingomonas sp. RIT328]EZP56979.1 Alpha amylase, catalytic domain containing protein [Sphingomonas sp. RIT328]
MLKFATRTATALALLIGAPAVAAQAAPAAPAADYRARLPQDEVIFFLLPDRFDNGDPANDRGGLKGGPLVTGFDPTAKGFYHGGDLKGLTRRLDYIQALGATALWVGPIFKNKPVQGSPGQQSAGYHGYWITDFTQVDPHFGSNADFAALVTAAHARGMKVYMDIIVNHTADVIQYRECVGQRDCPYRSRADYPYQRRLGVNGAPINPGFAGDTVHTEANFAKLTRSDYAYTPFVPAAERSVKVPAWLNDVRYYHNRGDTTYLNESATMGDFVGLDDLMTENPRVVAGMIDIFGDWIDRYGIDGFRIDTARHVNPEFWAQFVPAMQARARAKGIPNFHIFGEVSDHEVRPAVLAQHTIVDKLPAVLDFSFRQAVIDTVAGRAGTDTFEKLFDGDALYAKGFDTAVQLPTFTGNHDDGRFATFVRKAFPQADDAEVLARVMLSNAMLLTLRGVPTIYSGDEQGFVSDGNDQDAREDMFASRVAVYNDNRLLGSSTTTATAHFATDNPLFRQTAALARLRLATPALTRGRQQLRARGETPGLLAISRFDPVSGVEVLLAFNTDTRPLTRQVEIGTTARAATTLAGSGCGAVAAPGSLTVTLPPLGYAVCALKAPQ